MISNKHLLQVGPVIGEGSFQKMFDPHVEQTQLFGLAVSGPRSIAEQQQVMHLEYNHHMYPVRLPTFGVLGIYK